MRSFDVIGHRARLRRVAVGSGIALVSTVLVGGAAATPPASPELSSHSPSELEQETEFTDGVYIVQLKEEPAATAPAAGGGSDFDAQSTDAVAYRRGLQQEQQRTLSDVGAEAIQHYTVVTNGFAAELSAEQARRLSADRRVLSVQADEQLEVDTISSPEFLGLEGADGVWAETGGPDQAGEGTVVGVLDTGYWPENASFDGYRLPNSRSVTESNPGPAIDIAHRHFRDSDTANIALTHYYKKDGETFRGACEGGEEFGRRDCNTKVISARYFAEGFLASVPEENRSEFEYISARDGAGHGSHTASTAAGNHGVEMAINDRVQGTGSGMAPAAKLAVYKVCWEDDDPDTGGCYTQDILAAINQAVEDRVDVLNYSISGTRENPLDAVEIAFLNAADTGTFVAASAGNSGPGESTVAHPSPWLTTVAASTHQAYEGTVTLGDGSTVTGASITDESVPSAPLVYAGDVPADGAPAADAALCLPNSLDASAVADAIVVCDRGQSPRAEKSQVTAEAGAVGTVLANVNPGESLDADDHANPTVHVDNVDGATVKDYLDSAGTQATAAIAPGVAEGDETPVPRIAGFSSRGPSLAAESDLLKPDIAAPGVSVVAAVAPGPYGGRDHQLMSGTSMASPHVAGLGAFILGENPGWSPMMVKSAMMTTGYDLLDADGEASAEPFDQGAGHVDPSGFLNPGLVYNSGTQDWLDYLAGQGAVDENGEPVSDNPIDASDLNTPSIAIGELAGPQEVTRTVTAIEAGTYEADVTGLPGVDATVEPASVTLEEGESATFTIEFAPTSEAVNGEFTDGFLTWSGPEEVQIPLVVRPVSLSVPAEVTGSGTDGAATFDVVSGTANEITASVTGMVPGDVSEGSLVPGPVALENNESNMYVVEEVNEQTSFARFETDPVAEDDDLDLFVYRFTGENTVALVAQSATATAAERVDLTDPEPGEYLVLVNNYSVAEPGQPSEFSLTNYVVGNTDQGNLTVDPSSFSAPPGETLSLTASWNGLETETPYLGRISYTGALASTVVSIGTG